MEVLELCLLAIYRGLFKVSDILLGQLRIEILRGPRGVHFVYCLHLWWYFWLLKNPNIWQDNDIFVSFGTCLNVLVTLKFVARLYWVHLYNVFCVSKKALTEYGWRRCIIYGISVCSVALFLVFTATSAFSLSWNAFGDEVIGRLEDSIIDIEEDRTHFANVMVHPITQGKSDPSLFYKMYRYPMEDVQMTCKVKTVSYTHLRAHET